MNSPSDRRIISASGNFDRQHPNFYQFGALHEGGSEEERIIRTTDVEQEVVAPHPLHGLLLYQNTGIFHSHYKKDHQAHFNPNEFHNMPINYTLLFNKLYAKTEARRNEASQFTR